MRRHRISRKSPDHEELSWNQGSGEAPESMALADPSLKITPISFFSVSAMCRRRRESSKSSLGTPYRLPRLGALCGENPFAAVALAWDRDGLAATINVDKAFEGAFFPDIQKGDSVEFFIDTRDSKIAGFNSRFCHHFFFLPKEVDGHIAGEITRFRTEDVHEWCDSKDLQVTANHSDNSYSLDIFIPAHCLHGYDPDQCDRLGFTYRINRPGQEPQHFAVCSRDYQVEQQPSLWASLRLSA